MRGLDVEFAVYGAKCATNVKSDDCHSTHENHGARRHAMRTALAKERQRWPNKTTGERPEKRMSNLQPHVALGQRSAAGMSPKKRGQLTRSPKH